MSLDAARLVSGAGCLGQFLAQGHHAARHAAQLPDGGLNSLHLGTHFLEQMTRVAAARNHSLPSSLPLGQRIAGVRGDGEIVAVFTQQLFDLGEILLHALTDTALLAHIAQSARRSRRAGGPRHRVPARSTFRRLATPSPPTIPRGGSGLGSARCAGPRQLPPRATTARSSGSETSKSVLIPIVFHSSWDQLPINLSVSYLFLLPDTRSRVYSTSTDKRKPIEPVACRQTTGSSRLL